MYIKFLDAKTPIECSVKRITPNVIELRFANEIILDVSGFNAYKDADCEYNIGGNTYLDYTTVYRNDETTVVRNGYQLSNDGSIYVKPYAKVNFNASVGGSLDGAVMQEVYKYEELIIPEPIADADYEFSNWSPEIPSSGDVNGNKTFTAIFVSALEPEEPEQPSEPSSDLAERVLVLEEDVKKINEALGGAQ